MPILFILPGSWEDQKAQSSMKPIQINKSYTSTQDDIFPNSEVPYSK